MKHISDHISARKESITYKNFEVFIRNLTHRNLVTEDLRKVSILYSDMK